MSDVVASGTVTVRELNGHREWEEIVEVFERDLEDTNGDELCVEFAAVEEGGSESRSTDRDKDVARRVAQNKALPRRVETLGVDLA